MLTSIIGALFCVFLGTQLQETDSFIKQELIQSLTEQIDLLNKDIDSFTKQERIQALTLQIDLLNKDGEITEEDIKRIFDTAAAAPAHLVNDKNQEDERTIAEKSLLQILTKMKSNEEYKNNLKERLELLKADSKEEREWIKFKHDAKRFGFTKELEELGAKIQAERAKKAAAKTQTDGEQKAS